MAKPYELYFCVAVLPVVSSVDGVKSATSGSHKNLGIPV
jgi:hypothetical protein